MLSQLLTIARNTFVESVRQPIYFVIIALAGLCLMLTTWSAGFTMGMTESGEVSGDNKLLLDIGMATIFVCGVLLAAFLATAVISREIDNKTVLTVVSKPVSRVTLVLGKYVGVAGAILIAGITMAVFLLICIRHEVMSTAADDVDGPVVVFSLLAIGLSLAVAIWCNFFYGWVFSQTATMLLFPLSIAAYLGVLLVSKHWQVQPLWTDFKPQISLAAASIVMALLVLTALATAASARLGQVMTLVVCCGAFMLGMLSNHFLGSRAMDNQFVGVIGEATPELANQATLDQNGDVFNITLAFDPRRQLNAGLPFYFGPNPNGFGLAVPAFEPFKGSLTELSELGNRDLPPALVIVGSQGSGKILRVQRVGADRPLLSRPPQAGDYVFLAPTRFRPVFLAAWTLIPNIQFFWLIDAVSQDQPIPGSHILLVGLYGICQIGVFLSLAVMLFQRREVG
jgi:hypothetical protein